MLSLGWTCCKAATSCGIPLLKRRIFGALSFTLGLPFPTASCELRRLGAGVAASSEVDMLQGMGLMPESPTRAAPDQRPTSPLAPVLASASPAAGAWPSMWLSIHRSATQTIA